MLKFSHGDSNTSKSDPANLFRVLSLASLMRKGTKRENVDELLDEAVVMACGDESLFERTRY